MQFPSAKRQEEWFRELHSSTNKLAPCLVLVAHAELVWLADLAVICPKKEEKNQEEKKGTSNKITRCDSHAVCYSFLGIIVHLDLHEGSQAVVRLRDSAEVAVPAPLPQS